LLASLGYITQPYAEFLREVGRQRNLIVHGDITVGIKTGSVDTVIAAVEAVLNGRSISESTQE